MFSEHVEIAERIRQVFIEHIDDERKICSLEVNVLDLKTFEILLMDRQAIVGIDEADRLAAGDDAAVHDLLVDLCRTVHTPLYDRRKVLVQTRQHIYAILEDAGLFAEFRREFLHVYEETFHEEERSDDRSRMLEVSLEVDWLKSRIAQQLVDRDVGSDEESCSLDDSDEGGVTVEISGQQITIDIPETPDVSAEGLELTHESAVEDESEVEDTNESEVEDTNESEVETDPRS